MSRFGEPSPLEIVTNEAIRELHGQEIGSEEYGKKLEHVVKLHKMLTEEKSAPVSKDTLILAGANLLGIVLIVKHEYANVITSKALNLVLKPRS